LLKQPCHFSLSFVTCRSNMHKIKRNNKFFNNSRLHAGVKEQTRLNWTYIRHTLLSSFIMTPVSLDCNIGLGIDTIFTIQFDFYSHAFDSIRLRIRFDIDYFGCSISVTVHGKFSRGKKSTHGSQLVLLYYNIKG